MPANDYEQAWEVNATTGEVTRRDLTSAEVTERDALSAAATAQHVTNDAIAVVRDSAEPAVQALPGWVSWDESELLTWFDNNTGTNAEVVAAVRKMAQMLIAMRNELWPHLEGN